MESTLEVQFQLHIYGSYASGLCLPSSDVDFIVEFPDGVDGKDYFELIEVLFKKSSEFIDVKYIKFATMPVLKLTTSTEYESFKVDMTIKDNNHYGLNCVQFVKQILSLYPPLKAIVLVIKHLLNKV